MTPNYKTRTYKSWEAMKDRCYRKAHRFYKDYGGRGISVCERWRISFRYFLVDMGHRPKGMSLGRIDNDGDYMPGNCEWQTPTEQNNNSRWNKRIRFEGKIKTIAQWARDSRCKVTYSGLRARLGHGWSMSRALRTPNESPYKNAQCGSKNLNSVLNEEQVMDMRKLRKTGVTVKDLAFTYGIGVSSVHKITEYKSWRHVA